MKKILFFTLLILCGCGDNQPSSDEAQRAAQEQLSQQSNLDVGMPTITNFQEKRILKNIYELRDTEIKTITYTQDMNGNLHKLCDSIGYGIPYATEYTNPQSISDQMGHFLTLPQADPNGLFSPANAEGTWVLCLNTETKKISPVYVEPRIITSPFSLKQ